MASLFVIQGRDQGRRFEVRGQALALGRDAANQIQLRDTEVSRRHAEVRHEDARWWVVDLGSSNGTYVNGEKIARHELKSGDRVQLGGTLMIYTAADSGAVPAPIAEDIDIVGQSAEEGVSRILHKLPHDSQGDLFAPRPAKPRGSPGPAATWR